METLIKLLNEYEEDKIKGTKGLSIMFVWKYEGVLYYYDNYKDENVFDNIRLLIISKEYGFIEWLVEKNKVDFSNIKRIILNYKVEDNETIEYYDLDFATKEETLLMLLAVSDSPIPDLISYLK